MHQNIHTSLLINCILVLCRLPIQIRPAAFHSRGLVTRATAFSALPLQPVRWWRGNPVDKALLFHDGEFPLWVYYNFVIKISRKKHTQPPSSLPSGRVVSLSGEKNLSETEQGQWEKICEWEREKKEEEDKEEVGGSKLKVAKWRYWVSRGVRQE